MPFKWNPLSASLDYFESQQAADEALSARTLKTYLIADENISALKLIYQTSSTNGAIGDYSLDAKKDIVGISVTAAAIGEEFAVLLFGKVEDLFFNYNVNELLFLGANGSIVTTAPTSGFSVLVGKGLGTGSIFIDIERPITL